MNDDWDLALELICPDDFGLHWLPPASQSPPKNGRTDLDASSWTIDLLSQNKTIQNNAILEMALHHTFVTSTADNCLYGANLLTLCLLKPARPDVLQQVINLATKEAPKYLNLPDAIGRTPLWVDLENQDHASIQLLLKSGADPLQACKFSPQGEAKSPLSQAAKSASKEIFRDLLRAMIDQGEKFTPYDFNEDSLYLKHWAACHSSKDVLWLADQVEVLRGPLFCCNDVSGSSYFYRSVIDGSLGYKIKNGNEDLIEWLRKLDTSPAISKDIESSPLYAAASQGTIHTYLQLSDFFFDIDKDLFCNVDMDDLDFRMTKNFYLTHTVKNYEDYLDSKPEPLQVMKSQAIIDFVKEQLKVLLENHSELNFDEFSRTVKSVWPFISDDEKNTLLKEALFISNDHKELVLGLLDSKINVLTLEEIILLSAHKKNTAVFELAVDLSDHWRRILRGLEARKPEGEWMLEAALAARSLKWVNKLINAGFDLQAAIYRNPALIIALADLDPRGLAKKLKGRDYKIAPYMIEQTKTEAGKQALMALMTKASNNS